MSQQDAQDTAARTRIVSHMNKDHHDSIIRYLQHFNNLSIWTASNSTMTDVDLTGMTFRASGKPYRIPFDPPLKSYRDARERVVEMDKRAVEALGRSDITIREFVPPSGIYMVIWLVIAGTFLGYSQRWWFAKGQVLEQVLGSAFARFSWIIQPWLIGGMLLIHGTELTFFVPKYLLKHSVSPRTSVFWLWVFTTFVEGQFSFIRFKSLVERKREEKRKQKH